MNQLKVYNKKELKEWFIKNQKIIDNKKTSKEDRKNLIKLNKLILKAFNN